MSDPFRPEWKPFEIDDGVPVGHPQRPLLIAGPCAIESEKMLVGIAERLKRIAADLDLPFVFKASFDKANRTSGKTYRGPGLEDGLKMLRKVRGEAGVAVTTDIHEPGQAEAAAEVVDLIQIPAFLCRQTDLLAAAGGTGKPVNIKKGQFMSPEGMRHAVGKVRDAGADRILVTERGSTFGYGDLVVDLRSLPVMRRFAPVVFDATHSVQRPNGLAGSTGGDRAFVPVLAAAAAAAGADAFFLETHPDPDASPSDGANMIPLDDLPGLLKRILAIARTAEGTPA